MKKTIAIFFLILIFTSCAKQRKNPFDIKNPNYIVPTIEKFYIIGSDKVVYLFWNKIKSTVKVSYNIYRKDENSSFNLIARSNEPKYADTNVENGKSYYYKIKTLIENKESKDSIEKQVTPNFIVQDLKINWTKYTNNPVFKKSENKEHFDFMEIQSISVVYVNNQYVMFYSAHKENEDIDNDNESDNPFRIGRAISLDGIVWKKEPEGNPVLDIGNQDEFDGYGTLFPKVLYDEDAKIYRMWYTGQNTKNKTTQYFTIGYAWSNDGLEWLKSKNNPIIVGEIGSWDETGIFTPCIYYDKETKQYHLWYRGAYKDEVYIGYAFANNPEINWVKFPFDYVMEDEDMWSYTNVGTVIKELNCFHMWFSGREREINIGQNFSLRVGYAYSYDGIKWIKATNSVLTPNNEWETAGIFYPTIIKQNDKYHMWYIGTPRDIDRDDITNNSVGYAIGTKP